MGRKNKPAPRDERTASRPGLLHAAWLPPVALALITALLYARSFAVPILDLDDNSYFFGDARIVPISAANVWRILTQPFLQNYHPVTTLTLALDRAVWGSWVPGFHITQLAFYMGGVLALYFLFARILGWSAGAFVAAALFAAHTIHVESVAWLASRKDVVCLFFYALTLIAYARYASAPKLRWGAYAASLGLGAAAMLSKGYALALPGVLLAYDLCYTRRLRRRNWIDKIPFLAAAIAVGLVTAYAQERDSALIQSAITGMNRVALLAKVMALYVGRALVPVRLSLFYTVAGGPVGAAAPLGAFLTLALVAGFFMLRRRNPAAAFGIALFLLPLGTVLNVFFTLRIWMTDRYLLFPTIGSCLALVALAAPPYRTRRGANDARAVRRVLAVLAACAIGFYSALTLARVHVWTSRVALWSDVVRKELRLPGSGPVTAEELRVATNLRSVPSGPIVSLARAYDFEGKRAEGRAIDALMGTVARGGAKDEEGGVMLARRALEAGRPQEALQRLRPIADGATLWSPVATLWMSVAESRMGDADASRQSLGLAIERYKKSGQFAADGLIDVGDMEFANREFSKAGEWYRLAGQEAPRDARVLFRLGRALEEGGAPGEALKLYAEIVEGNLPIVRESVFTILDVHYQMGVAAQKLGRRQEAIRHFDEALRGSPEPAMRADIMARLRALRGNASG